MVRERDPQAGPPGVVGITVRTAMAIASRSFVAAKQASGLIITTSGIVVTVCWSHSIACREGVLACPRARRVPVSIP